MKMTPAPSTQTQSTEAHNHINGDSNDDEMKGADKSSTKTSSSNGTDSNKTNTESSPAGAADSASDSDSKQAKNPEPDPNDPELIFIHDNGFTIKIQAPGIEPFDVQVSSMELVQEIHHLLMDREDTCHRTCFSLQLDGMTLDNFAELKSIEGLKEGSLIKVVEEPYTMREARIHVRHVRDLLKSLDPADSYKGVECNSLSFLNTVAQGDLERKPANWQESECTPPDHVMPGSRDRPLLPLHPISKDQKGPQALKVLTTSGWNPPPGPRKLHGDLMYLYVVTMEDKRFHLTASTRGFYINESTESEFNPKPASKNVYHSLIDLLGSLSPAFKKAYQLIQKKRHQKHPFERVATPYQMYQWVSPTLEHNIDAMRAEDAFSSKLGYEEHIPGQTRDWNEELQTTRELPRKSLPERLLRERAIFKVHGDFVAAATRGAQAVVDGNVMAINPGEETKMQMFIWNNIFFSLGFDVRDHYKELGGDAAAYAAPINDLQGVKAYSAVDVEGLYTLGTVVVDYRGCRVTAQSIIPGILEREQDQSVVYGSVDFGKTCSTHPKYMELLGKASSALKIMPHKVVTEKGEEVEICSSVECKGIIGNDSRHYILDLLRTFPPDVNFLPDMLAPDDDLSPDVKAMGYPRKFIHKLCCLRQELVDAFFEHRYMLFIKLAAYHLQQLGLKSIKSASSSNDTASKDNSPASKENGIDAEVKETQANTANTEAQELKQTNGHKEEEDFELVENVSPNAAQSDNLDQSISEKKESGEDEQELSGNEEEYKKMVESITASGERSDIDSTREIVRKAAQTVGSLKDNEFDIKFNPDLYSPGVKHPEDSSNSVPLSKQRQLIKDAAAFLLQVQIPGFIRDCLDHSTSPYDGATLTEALHNRGINMRYLGRICDVLSKLKPLEYLYSIAVTEVIARATKHVFNNYLQSVEAMSLASAISHFLNCLLSSCASLPTPPLVSDELHVRLNGGRRRGKKRSRRDPLNVQDTNDWVSLSGKSLWSQIKAELNAYYGWRLEADLIDTIVDKYGVQKISLLRALCMKCGIQILLREYNFDHKSKPAFTEDDIVNLFPVVKHIHPRASDALTFFTTGQAKIQQGHLKEGYELISEALNLLNNVYGAMHPEICQCLRLLARLNYIMGDHQEALAFQQKAVIMSEKVNGIDHPYTISEYIHLALYCFANSQVGNSLRLLYRARYLLSLICGENHPEMATIDSNIGLILHAIGDYDLSLKFLENALKLCIQYFGPKSLKVAVAYHLVARTQSCQGDFRGALQAEKETYAIYKQNLGEFHEKTRESSECLKHLTTQAVVLQKKINEVSKGNTTGTLIPPIQIQPPSMSSVLDMLNIINGILFIQISLSDSTSSASSSKQQSISQHQALTEEPPE